MQIAVSSISLIDYLENPRPSNGGGDFHFANKRNDSMYVQQPKSYLALVLEESQNLCIAVALLQLHRVNTIRYIGHI